MDLTELAVLLEQAKSSDQAKDSDTAVTFCHTILTQTSPLDPTTQSIRLDAFEMIGRLYASSGQYKEGLAFSEQYHQEANTYTHQRWALLRIGTNAYHLGENKRALWAYQTTLELSQQEADEPGIASAYSSIASVYSSLGRLTDAVTYFHRAIELFKQLGQPDSEAGSWNRLGLVYQQLGEIDKAIDAHQRYLHFIESTTPPSSYLLMIALDNLGEDHLVGYDTETAHRYFARALALADKEPNPHIVADLYRNQGLAYCYAGNLEAGLQNLRHAYALSQEDSEVSITAQALFSLAWGELEAGNVEAGFESARKLLSLAGETGARGHYANAIHVLGRYYQQIGDTQTAEQYWQEAVYLAHEMNQRLLLWRLHARLAEIAATPALAQVHIRIAVEIIERIAATMKDPALQDTFRQSRQVQAVLSQRVDNL